jgi:glycosyltransferase involved in cell wall biosynthesis
MLENSRATKYADACWITWERHQRSLSITSELGIPLLELNRSGGRAARYFHNSLATIRALLARRYRRVFVQVPSVVLGCLGLLLARLRGARLIVDAHNAVIEGAEGAPQPLRSIYRLVLRHADIVIVTNAFLAERVRRLGGTPAVLPDPVPAFRADRAVGTEAGSVVVISTWADDEPLEAVLDAAALLPPSLRLTITGKPRGSAGARAAGVRGVHLSGFVSHAEYLRMLTAAQVVVDLTTREDCLVCGAYEALALGRPLVVSDTRALRALLDDAALYTDNSAAAIAHAVSAAAEQHAALRQRCEQRRVVYLDEWRAFTVALERLVA